jgi:hypothetical protein
MAQTVLVPGFSTWQPDSNLNPVPVSVVVDKVALWQVSVPVLLFPTRYHFTNGPYSSLPQYHCYQKDKRAYLGTFSSKNSNPNKINREDSLLCGIVVAEVCTYLLVCNLEF